MSVLAWLAAAAVVAAAVLFGRTASVRAGLPGGRRAVTVSVAGPVVVAVAGFALAAVSGAWLPAAAGTMTAVVAVAVAGLVLTP